VERGSFTGAAEAKPAVCREACDKGAIVTCLALAGASLYGLEGVEGWDKVVALANKVAQCGDKEACEKAGLAAQPGPLSDPRMPDLAGHFGAYAYLARACELGAAEACEAASTSLQMIAGPRVAVVALSKRGCELSDGYACAAIANDGGRDKAVQLLGAKCEAGDVAACDLAISVAPEGADRSKIETKLAALERAACDANEVERCRDLEVRLTKAGALCTTKGKCKVMCDAAEELTGGSFVHGIGADAVGKVQAIVKVMTADEIVELCFDVILDDPCSCGCC